MTTPFPTQILNISVQLLINGTWTDITGFVYARDDIHISGRGRPDWTQTLEPSECTITLNNINGNFSPLNINGLFYPYLTRNTQLRIYVNSESGSSVVYTGYRFWGEVNDWPPQWDSTGADVYVDITVNGVMARYIQGGLIGSPMKRFYLLKTDATAPVALWTMEDLSGSTQFSNQINNVDPMTWTGTPTVASDSTSFQGCDPLPLVSMAAITGNTGSYSASGVVTFATPGTYQWTCPGSVTSVTPQNWGAGGGGADFVTGGSPSGGGAGGGGEYASSTALTVVPGTNYTVVVGTGGAAGVGANANGSAGTASTFTVGATIITANGGSGGTGVTGGAGGTGSANPTHFNGGAGANGGAGTSGGGVTTHTQTWNAVHTYSYEGINADSSPDPGFTPGALINTDGNLMQGDDQLGDNGNCSGVILLPYATIHSAMSGYQGINYVNVTLHNLHSWYNSGMTLACGSVNYTGSFGASRQFGTWGFGGGNQDNFETFFNEGQTKTFTLPSFYYPPFASLITAFILYHKSSSRNYYGYWSGGTSPSVTAQWTTGTPNITTGSGGGGGAAAGSAGAGAAGTAGTASSGGQGGIGGTDPDGSGGQGGSYPGNGNSGSGPGGGGGGGSYNSTSAGNGAAGQVVLTYGASTTPNNVVTRFCLSIPPTGAVDQVSIIRTLISSGSLTYVECYYGKGGKLGFHGYSGATLKFDSGLLALGADGTPMMVSLELAVSGANINWQIRAVVPGGTSYIAPSGNSGTFSTATIGAASEVVINPLSTLNDTTIGVVVVQYALEDMITTGLANCLNGHTGELAATRFRRLCAEEGIGGSLRNFSQDTDTPAMGPQRNMSFTDTLQQIEDCDQGLLMEARDMLGLYYRTRANLSNQVNPVVFDYAQQMLSGTFNPTEDDALTRNDITVSRINGISNNIQLLSGPLSIQFPPNGVGDYAYSIDVNFNSDTQVIPMSVWMLSEGTAGGQRYQNIEIDLTRLSTQSLFNLVPTMDDGDFFQVINTPLWMPVGPADQLAWNFDETLNAFKWVFAISSVPQAPYDTDFLDTGLSGSGSNSGFEGPSGSLGTWGSGTNCSVAVSSAVTAHGGSWEMAMTSTAAGDMTAQHCSSANYATQMLQVVPGEYVYVSGYAQAATVGRGFYVGIDWFTSAGVEVVGGPYYGPVVGDFTGGWWQNSFVMQAPATAAWARAMIKIAATGAASEVHYIDDVHLIGNWW